MADAPRLTARVAALLGIVAGAAACGLTGPPPDVFVVAVDGARVEQLGAYGARSSAAPALDAFAADAATFSYTWSTSCAPVPALASILTGRFPTAHGATSASTRVPASVATLAELLGARGWEVSAFRSGTPVPAASGVLRGYRTHDAPDAGALTRAALAWLRAVPRERPVHALLSYGDLSAHAWADARVTDDGAAERYRAALHAVDEHIGRLLEGLRAAGRFDDALVVVTGTSGEALGEHGLAGHGVSLYEEAIRVPLFLRYPGGVSGASVVETPASLADLLAVVADEAGVPLPDDAEAVPIGERNIVFAECARDPAAIAAYGSRVDRELFAAIRPPWKMIVSDRDAPELYRLGSDERKNEYATARGVAVDLVRTINDARAAIRPPS